MLAREMNHGNAFHVLHHEIGQAIIGRPSIQETCDVGMIESRQNTTFGPESIQDLIGVRTTLQYFDSNLLLELTIGATSEIDRAHAAAAQLANYRVTANEPSGRKQG